VRDLQGLGPDRAAAAFAPASAEIVSLSGGADYDDQPGDDGVTVYLRLHDSDGDAVKAPGRIVVQLLDNSNLASPRVVGLYRFERVEALRKAWYDRFGTRHYALRCPFSENVEVPRRISVKVEFLDYLTGRKLTATQDVEVNLAGRPGERSPSMASAPDTKRWR
jgi:hypothetical protein